MDLSGLRDRVAKSHLVNRQFHDRNLRELVRGDSYLEREVRMYARDEVRNEGRNASSDFSYLVSAFVYNTTLCMFPQP
jgi:hypothetical protein